MIFLSCLILAAKKITGGILSVILIAGIKRSKEVHKINSIKEHIEFLRQKDTRKAMQLYGNDTDSYLVQTYPEKESFLDLLVVNAFRPLFVLILVSVFDSHNAAIFFLHLVLVLLLYPLETIYAEKWKKEGWYIFIIILLWLLAFAVITYSQYLSLEVVSTPQQKQGG